MDSSMVASDTPPVFLRTEPVEGVLVLGHSWRVACSLPLARGSIATKGYSREPYGDGFMWQHCFYSYPQHRLQRDQLGDRLI